MSSLPQFDNLTKQTTQDTANTTEKEDCEEFLDEVYVRLALLGLDLSLVESEEDSVPESPSERFMINDQNKALYERFLKMVSEVNPDIVATPMKVYIKFELDKNILFSIDQRKNGLMMFITAEPGLLSDPKGFLVPALQGHHGVGHVRIDIADESQLKDIADLINQRINF